MEVWQIIALPFVIAFFAWWWTKLRRCVSCGKLLMSFERGDECMWCPFERAMEEMGEG